MFVKYYYVIDDKKNINWIYFKFVTNIFLIYTYL